MEIYMDKKLLVSAISLAFSSHAMAESYQFEGNTHYANTKYDYFKRYDADMASISGVYYFSPVKTDNHPLQEAAFLEKNSSLSLAYLSSKLSYDYYYDDSLYNIESHDTSKYSAAILAVDSYLLDGFLYMGGFIARDEMKDANYSKVIYKTTPNLNHSGTTEEKETENSWRVNVGLAPINGLLVWSEFQKDIDVNDSWNVNAKYVMEFDGSAFNVQAGYGYNSSASLIPVTIYPANMKLNFTGMDEDKLITSYILGDYYFDNTFSLGLGAINNNANNDDVYMVRARKFFTESFSAQAAYIKDTDVDNYSVGISLRF
jgi:hypothetical protein